MRGTTCFIDTNIFVNAFVNLNAEKNRASRTLMEQLEQGDIKLVTDFLVLTETYYIIEKYKGIDTAVDVVKTLLTLNDLEIVSIDRYTFFEALKRTKKYRLKMNDKIHYTIALLKGVSGFYSYDKDFNGLEIKRIEP
jgi:predicted nucleic acid-binding protein